MKFIPYSADQYRELDDIAFEARRKEIVNLLSADKLPENVTDEMLYAERDLIVADNDRREAAAELRNQTTTLVAQIAPIIATDKPKTERKTDIREVTRHAFTDSIEYRRALAAMIANHTPIPDDMMEKARQERATQSIIVNGDYNAAGDFSNTYNSFVAIPNSLQGEIIREMKETYGVLWQRTRQMSVQGGITFTAADLELTATWINDTEVSPYQEQTDGTTFSFAWHQLEARFARTMLADALLRDDFKSLVAPELARAMAAKLDAAILNGNGTTQPLGILVDPRLVGAGTEGQSGYIAPTAAIMEVTEADMEDWKFWHKLLYNTATFNRLYRNQGEWLFGDSTWGLHLDLLEDSNGRPLYKDDPYNDEQPLKLRNRPVTLVDDSILPSFDAAADGEVFGIFGNLNNYVINTQPGMAMSTVRWDDHETNTKKTKVLTALDGRVVNPYGFALLKKKVVSG